MKFKIAVAGIIVSTGIFVFSSMNVYLEKKIKLVLLGSSFLGIIVSTSTLANTINSSQEKIDKISKDADLELATLQQQNEDLINSLQNKIVEATQEKDIKISELAQDLDDLTRELKTCDARLENASIEIANRYEAEIAVIQQQLNDKYTTKLNQATAVSDELRNQLDLSQHKLEQFYSRENNIISEERRLEDIKKQLNLYKEQLKINQEKSALEVEKALLAEKEKFDELVRTNELYKHQLLKYQDALNSLQSENTNLKNSSKLRIAHGASYEAYLSQIIQNTYLENEINVSFAEFNRYGDTLAFKFYLVDSTKASKALKINHSLELSTGKFCNTEIKGGYLLVKTENEKSRDVNPIVVTSGTTKKRDTCWLDDTFVKSHHDLIIGATGRGKSTLVDNIAALANIHFGGNAEIFVIDPKYPYTEWKFAGKKFKPQYKGLNAINEDFRTSFDGLQDMVNSLQNRLDAATIAAENGDELPEIKPQIWVVDESLMLREYDKELHSKAIKLLSTVGRALKIRIILLTQESNVNTNGLTVSGSFNFTRYYLGDSAKVPSVINREIKSATEKNEIVAKTSDLIERGEKYFGLICPGEEKAFVEVLPPPGFYAEQQNPPQKDESEIQLGKSTEQLNPPEPPKVGMEDNRRNSANNNCPKCGGKNLLKNGVRSLKSGKVQRYKCGDCGKQFSVKMSNLISV
ncbi:hypothetical protein [Okeania sp. SIO1I7]|uniref:IS1/IS1595 family N-terminal zinc-binding domain-containing protein n=1 Tax=Okeania sp. SIO1I7 TaxID=2607772 RepID=UPI0013F8938C|nr:hypothetical protein [Okeania sp. SIO1I7]NET30199.1 hypothetical protein [Okeania sp. SIO1I7]